MSSATIQQRTSSLFVDLLYFQRTSNFKKVLGRDEIRQKKLARQKFVSGCARREQSVQKRGGMEKMHKDMADIDHKEELKECSRMANEEYAYALQAIDEDKSIPVRKIDVKDDLKAKSTEHQSDTTMKDCDMDNGLFSDDWDTEDELEIIAQLDGKEDRYKLSESELYQQEHEEHERMEKLE